jgi:hypothetical protein
LLTYNPAPNGGALLTTPNDLRLFAIRITATLLSIPLMRMELRFLPHWFSDYSYGLMFRLGLLFGIVVLIWNANSLQEFLRARNVMFVLASIASAWLGLFCGNVAHGDLGMFVLVVSGAICLALSQKVLLNSSLKQAIAAMILAPGFFYLVSFGSDKFVQRASLKEFIGDYMPYYWQLGYLFGMYGFGELLSGKKTISSSANN